LPIHDCPLLIGGRVVEELHSDRTSEKEKTELEEVDEPDKRDERPILEGDSLLDGMTTCRIGKVGGAATGASFLESSTSVKAGRT
jgi:hypothetical protein